MIYNDLQKENMVMNTAEKTSRKVKLDDCQIRIQLYSYLENNNDHVRIFPELRLNNSRADLLVVTDSVLTGYEIKSDLDSFARIKTQIANYDCFCDYCYVVIGYKHKQKVIKHVPDYWGILVIFKVGDKYGIELFRLPSKNPKAITKNKIKLLWRRELVNISFRNGLSKCSGKSRYFIKEKLIKNIDENKLLHEITHELFERDYNV